MYMITEVSLFSSLAKHQPQTLLEFAIGFPVIEL